MVSKNYLKVLILFVTIKYSITHDGHDHGHPSSDKGAQGIWKEAHSVDLKVCQGVDFKWISKSDNGMVIMEMSSFTKGYVSVGFCPKWKGTMEGCDIVMGWVSNQNGTAHIFDYYARGNTPPELDESQDYELIEGRQDLGITTIKFQRKWNTGDFYDANLDEGQVRVMWAWHPEDPFSPDSYFKHAGNSRGHMLEDISFRNPASKEHYHMELHSSGSNIHISGYMILGWLSLVHFALNSSTI